MTRLGWLTTGLALAAGCGGASGTQHPSELTSGAAAPAADGGVAGAAGDGRPGPAGAGRPAAGAVASPAAGSGGEAASSGAAGRSAAGAAGAQAADAGAGAGEAAAARPSERAGKLVLELDDVTIEIDPASGGRISKLEIAGQDLLTGPDVDAINWGSTFWPSPQQRWSWPPVPELDSQPYSGGIAGDAITLTSQVGERAKVKVGKRFRALLAERALDIEYTLSNEDTTPVSWAGWEITRVAPGGLTFFPTGSATVSSQLPITMLGPISWYRHDPATVSPDGQKHSADGSAGWLAHVAGDKLLLKQFVDVPPPRQAPAPEAEIAIYAVPDYVELEPQGPYTELQPGETLRWSVRWYVRQLPPDVTAAPGNEALVSFAQSLLR